MFRSLRGFFNSNSGNVAMTFAVASVAVFGAAGAAVDYSRALRAEDQLQSMADSAALAAAQETGLNDSQLQAYAQGWIDANGGMNALAQNLTATTTKVGSGVQVKITAETPSTFLGILGIEKLSHDVIAEAVTASGGDPVEMVIAMDTTASMNFGGNWQRSKDALNAMVTQLSSQSGTGNFMVSLLPFSDRVNVGLTKATMWDNITHNPSGYQGCLEPREENISGNPFTLTNKTPNQLRFDPSASGYYGPIYGGGTPVCPTEITGPTNDASDIAGGLNSVIPAGTGRFDVAAAWAWRMLSPSWVGQWGVANYPDTTGAKRKMAIIITDGHTVAYEDEVYSGGPKRPWGWNNGTPLGFDNLVDVCSGMKADGIEVFTIFLRGNDHFEPYMRNCATSADHFYDVSNLDQFETALSTIGESQGKLRLTK